jgi:probable phosphoglycerate mutase
VIVLIARHGETDWNCAGRYQGRLESSLTHRGTAQAQALDAALAGHPVARVVASPLRRCVDTAQPLSCRHGITVETDSRLLEIAHGNWEGRLRDDIERNDPQTMRRWREEPDLVHFQGGESLADVDLRWRAFARELHGNNEVVLVTHDVVVRLAILHATRRAPSRLWEPRVVNGGYARFTVDDEGWRLLDECVDAHLAGLFVDPATQAL